MLRTTLAEIRAHPTRLLGVLLAVALSVGFVVACLVFVDTEVASLQRAVAIRTAGSSVVVQPSDDRDLTPTITDTPGVETVEGSRSTWLDFSAGGQQGLLELSSLPADRRLQWKTLQRGAWPERPGEITLGRKTADRSHVGIGETVRVQAGGVDGSDPVGDAIFRGQANATGAAYAPYLYDVAMHGDQVVLRYTLSTWNPYQVVLMRHGFELSTDLPLLPKV